MFRQNIPTELLFTACTACILYFNLSRQLLTIWFNVNDLCCLSCSIENVKKTIEKKDTKPNNFAHGKMHTGTFSAVFPSEFLSKMITQKVISELKYYQTSDFIIHSFLNIMRNCFHSLSFQSIIISGLNLVLTINKINDPSRSEEFVNLIFIN